MTELECLRELVAINRTIAGSLDHGEVLRWVVQQAAAVARADAGVLLLVDGDDQAIVSAAVGVDEEQARHFRARGEGKITAGLRELMGAGDDDRLRSVPVISQGRRVGLLALCRQGLEPPRPREEFLLLALADQAAIALERAAHDRSIRQERERGQEALRIIAARARCILWYADVEERGEASLRWDLKLFDPDSAERFFPVQSLPGMSYVEAWYESRLLEDRARMDAYGDGEVRAGRSYRQEFRCRRRDGEIRWLEEDVQIETLAADRWRAVGVCTDITDRKRAMEGIERQREDLQSLIIQSPVPICVYQGPELVYEMANAAYLEVVGGREIVGKPLLEALPEFRGQGFDEVLRGVMRAGQPVVGREARVMLEREGRLQETYWTFIYSPLRDEDGTVNRVVAVCDDVTERRRLVNELIEADRRKDEFLATLAHELRNPLAPLRTAVQLLRCQWVGVGRWELGVGDQTPLPHLPSPNSQPPASLQRAVDVIDRQVQQLVRLVDDLLDVSRITLDKLELRRERVTLATVVQAAVEASQSLIEQRGHTLTVTLPPEPVELDADLTRLAQVFLNLLNNAAKYTERGGRIQLAAERQGADVLIGVRDTGIGIARDMLPRVFEMFTQVDRSLDRSQGGLGIGLTLVKRLVQLHGGSIEASSEGPGRGSEFIVRLPIAAESPPGARPAEGAPAPAAPGSRHRVLVVDDNRDAAETMAELLELAGNELRTAHDGEEALEAAAEFRPELVLLDIGLPRMNGYDVARKIREQPWGAGMRLVALTGWGQAEDRQRSREAGFDHHMIKPVEPDALLKLLDSLDG